MSDPQEHEIPRELRYDGRERVGPANAANGNRQTEAPGAMGDRLVPAGNPVVDGQTGQSEVTGVSTSLPKIISFSSLVRCGDEVWIEHAGNLYRLRRTKQDKLILTK